MAEDERWDIPSAKLARAAAAGTTPGMRDCARCPHHHPKGERCGYPASSVDLVGCKCEG